MDCCNSHCHLHWVSIDTKKRKHNGLTVHSVDSNIFYTEQIIEILNIDYQKHCEIQIKRRRGSSTSLEDSVDIKHSLDQFIFALQKENIEYLQVEKNDKNHFFARVPAYCQHNQPGEILEFSIQTQA